ncbi:cupredoxin domain-containing protein [Candidatus Woesearchaeota archaeon]|nr:cupredoxin domain-containing protein [Candidatus Woesearchaeota archaeon]
MVNSFALLFVAYLILLVSAAAYMLPRRKWIDEMHGMMVGMTFGMIAGLVTATLHVLPTGDFLWGVIGGSLVGLLFGLPLGRLGGHLGVMEGVIAGPMGGMMGAMLGQMMRPFNADIFIPFFTLIIAASVLGLVYAVHCGICCCQPKKKPEVPKGFISLWTILALGALILSLSLSFAVSTNYSPQTNSQQPIADSQPTANSQPPTASNQELKLPAYLQQKEDKKEAILKGSVQEVDLLMKDSAYSPNVIVAKKGIPLRIKVTAEESAGCAREIVFPDFKIRKIIPVGELTTIEFTPDKAGTFVYHCSMDMARGKLVVE